MSRKVVNRRVVSERVIGSANPVARWGRQSKSTCWDSIGGFFVGILIFFGAFALPYFAAKTEKDSKDVSKLEVITIEQAAAYSGKALVQGVITPESQLTVPLVKDSKDILAFKYTLEHWETWTETHEETHTETRNGQDIEVTEQVSEEVSDWVVKKEDKKWAAVKLGSININPDKCNIDIPWTTAYGNEYTKGVDKYKETVQVVKGGMQVLLAAELEGGQVAAQPDFYRVYPGSKEELVSKMNTEEETSRWFLIIASIVAWTIAFNLMIGPAFLLLNILPIKEIGCAVRALFTFAAFLIACLMTWITYVAVRYWWLIAIIIVAIAVAVIAGAVKSKKQAKLDLDAPEPPPAEPTP